MPMTRRKQQAIETKQKLLDTADALVKERGFDAVSVDDIVAACGVAKGTFYHYFESKNDLLVYLTRTPYEELKRRFAKTSGKPCLTRLRIFLQDWFQMVEKYNLPFTVLYSRMLLSTPAEQRLGKLSQMDEGLNILQHCLQGAVESGELVKDTPVAPVSMAILFAMQGSAIYQDQHEDTFDVAVWAETFIGLVFDTILKGYVSRA